MLKKIALTAAALAALAGISYGAAGSTTFAAIDTIDGINFKTSTQVKVLYKNDAGTATTPQNYAIGAKHTSGDTYYATSNLSTSIYKKQDATKTGTELTASDTNITDVGAGFSVAPAEGYTPM